MRPQLSVIIPVYNAEPFLRECLDSLRKQSLQEIEILCINDGSPDGSKDILDQYSAKDSRIRVITQENAGAGAARNAGIAAASGDYLFFMDADDIVTPDGLEQACTIARKKQADLVRFRVHDYNQMSGEWSDSPHNALLLIPSPLFGIPLSFRLAYPLFPRMCVAPWGGIVQRDLVLRAGLHFNTLRCVNDRSFFWESIIAAKRIVLADVFVLYYRTHLSSSLIGSRLRHFDCHFRSYAMIERDVMPFSPRIRRCVLNGEMQDIANWLEQSRATELATPIADSCRHFISTMDKSPWRGEIRYTKWYKRIRRVLDPD